VTWCDEDKRKSDVEEYNVYVFVRTVHCHKGILI